MNKQVTLQSVKEFNKYFQQARPYIHHNLSDKEVQEYMANSNYETFNELADRFADYLLANNLAEVEE